MHPRHLFFFSSVVYFYPRITRWKKYAGTVLSNRSFHSTGGKMELAKERERKREANHTSTHGEAEKKLRQRNGIKTALKIAAPWCCTCVCVDRRVCVSTVAISGGSYGGGDGSRLLFLLPAFRLFSLFTTGWRVDHFCCWFPFFSSRFPRCTVRCCSLFHTTTLCVLFRASGLHF